MSVSTSSRDLLAPGLAVKALMKKNSFHLESACFELLFAKKTVLK